MLNIYIWIILGTMSLTLLTVYWRNRNAIWGGLTLGIIIGFMVAIVFIFVGRDFNWPLILKGAIIGTITGYGAELLGNLSDKFRRK